MVVRISRAPRPVEILPRPFPLRHSGHSRRRRRQRTGAPSPRAPSSTEPSAETEYALPSPTHTFAPTALLYSGIPRPELPHLPTAAAGNPMVSILSSALPTSSRFPPVVRFQPAAAKRQPVVAKARRGDGPTMMSMRPAVAMDPDAKRPWWSPVFGIGRSGRADSKDRTPDRGDDREGRSNRSGLTADKARLLRRKFRAMDSWHDAMYHSAIASRLACADHP